MGTFGPIHWLIVAVAVLLLFGGRGKISGMMGDTAKGIRAFREGLKGEDEAKHEDEEAEAKPLPKATAARKPAAKKTTKTTA
jgi:sec-independent protein translocase protein TatA